MDGHVLRSEEVEGLSCVGASTSSLLNVGTILGASPRALASESYAQRERNFQLSVGANPVHR